MSNVTREARLAQGKLDVGVPAKSLTSGANVEVLVRYQNHWARGFDVVAVDDDGYWLRRHSDGEILPVAFADDEVRPTH
jgi:hypothetical protein